LVKCYWQHAVGRILGANTTGKIILSKCWQNDAGKELFVKMMPLLLSNAISVNKY